MTKKFLLVLLLLSVVGVHAEPAFYAVKMKSSANKEIRGAFSWKLDSNLSYELQNGVLRETGIVYFEPDSQYVCIMTITDYHKVVGDLYASTNHIEVMVRSYGRGGKINGWTNTIESYKEMSPPGGNSMFVQKIDEVTRITIKAETSYEFNNSHDSDRRWKSYLNFDTNRGIVQGVPGPQIPAGSVVSYMPSCADVMTFAKKKGIAKLSILSPSYGSYLGDMNGLAKLKRTGKL